jgi:hypothetical protein
MTQSWKSRAGGPAVVPAPRVAGLAALCLAGFALLALGTTPALGALGAPLAAASADGSVAFEARSLRAGAPAGPSSTTVRTPAGVTVHEYAGADGVVFALAWSGPTVPDLQQLYGSYFPGYAAARGARASAGYRAPVRVRSAQLVAHAWGHMRDYAGSAYVPALVPPGTDLAALGVQP